MITIDEFDGAIASGIYAGLRQAKQQLPWVKLSEDQKAYMKDLVAQARRDPNSIAYPSGHDDSLDAAFKLAVGVLISGLRKNDGLPDFD